MHHLHSTMKGIFFCFLLALQMMSMVSIATRPFPPSHAMSHPGQKEETKTPSLPSPDTIDSEKGIKGREGIKEEEEAYERGVSKIGSSPPSCEHKCYGCSPCEAIQVPSTSSRRSHLGIEYANYEPESWKCKCGPSFYSP